MAISVLDVALADDILAVAQSSTAGSCLLYGTDGACGAVPIDAHQLYDDCAVP